MKDEMLTEVLIMGLEVLMNHIGLDDEDTMGSSVGPFDGMIYGKNLWIHFQKIY